MNHRRWLGKEVSKWIDEKIINKDTGDIILSRYKKEYRQWQGEAFGFLAFICVIFGIGFILSGYWTALTQNQRFQASMLLPVVSAIMMIAVVIFDKKIPVEDEPSQSANDVEVSEEDDEVVAVSSRKRNFRHRIASEIKEFVYTFHALSLVACAFLVMDSFKMNDDYYFIYSAAATFLLLLSYVTSSAGAAIVSAISVVTGAALSVYSTWTELLAWFYLILYLPFMVKLLIEKKHKSVIAFAWVWTLCILFLIFKSVNNLFWQVMFLSLASTLTWMTGGILHKQNYVSQSLKILGAISVFAVLLQSGFGNVWQNVSGDWILWILYVLFLCIDAFLVFRMFIYREGMAFLAGFTPFCMFISAVCANFVQNGSLSVICISVYSMVLAFALLWKGWKSGNILKRWIGFCIILAISAVRIIDSSFSMVDRGIFFIIIGIAAAVICAIFIKIATVKRKRKHKKIIANKDDENISKRNIENKEVSHE